MRKLHSATLRSWAQAVALAGTAVVGCGGRSQAIDADHGSATGGQASPPGAGNGGRKEVAGAGGSAAGNAPAGTSGNTSIGGQVGSSGAGPGAGGAAQTSIPFGSDEDDGISGGGASFFWGTATSGYLGNWFLSSADEFLSDAPVDPLEPPRDDSTYACHIVGEEFARGAQLVGQLVHPFNRPVDLSHFAGLSFWTRGVVAPSATAFVVMNDGARSIVNDASFAGLASSAFTISDTWQKVSFPFAGLDSITAVVSIDFVVLDAGEAIDVWIDEVALECEGACLL